jgi:hypothetical protein
MEDEMMKATTIAPQKIAMLAALAAARCEKYASAAPMPAMTRKISAESELLFLISNYPLSRVESSRIRVVIGVSAQEQKAATRNSPWKGSFFAVSPITRRIQVACPAGSHTQRFLQTGTGKDGQFCSNQWRFQIDYSFTACALAWGLAGCAPKVTSVRSESSTGESPTASALIIWQLVY